MGKHRSWVAHRRPVRRPSIAVMGLYKRKRLAPAWRAAGRGACASFLRCADAGGWSAAASCLKVFGNPSPSAFNGTVLYAS